ncbi:MAG: hypothetical protein QCH96_05575, partial [Candidatus Thermoplasmatota archaeon]|nr:hypothetical protein [Candidatus Thermoplasmatota archaeon]
ISIMMVLSIFRMLACSRFIGKKPGHEETKWLSLTSDFTLRIFGYCSIMYPSLFFSLFPFNRNKTHIFTSKLVFKSLPLHFFPQKKMSDYLW